MLTTAAKFLAGWKGYALSAAAALATAAGLYLAWQADRSRQWDAGYEQALAEGRLAAAEIERKKQKEVDDADQAHRSAVAQTEQAARAVRDLRARLDRLHDDAARAAADASAGSGPYDGGADWIGAFAACYAEYADLGADAARIADKLSGLQGWARAVQ